MSLPTGIFSKDNNKTKGQLYSSVPRETGWQNMTHPTRELTIEEIRRAASDKTR